MSISWEHHRLAMALDASVAWAPSSGTLQPSPSAVPVPYHDTLFELRTAWRIGLRFPMHDVAVAGGLGYGATLVDHLAGTPDPNSVAPRGVTASGFVPGWASVTVKPWCSFGAQVLASYDIGFGGASQNDASITAGLIFQPNRACSERPGVRVH